MGLLLNVQGVTKQFGADALFDSLSFTISDNDRIGLIGPNGAGKSTLLDVIAGRIAPDDGEVVARKLLRVAYVAQDSEFAPEITAASVLDSALPDVEAEIRWARVSETLGRAGFDDLNVEASTLSGGWRKRLAIAEALVTDPDVLLLDEPTNHLDLEGIAWLERLLQNFRGASMIVSHDRYFLENVANEVLELNRAYPGGLLRAQGNYSQFLEYKKEVLRAQAKQHESLENRVHIELAWLRRGPKARATKAKARIDRAHEMIDELAERSSRSRTGSVGIDFTASDRRTKFLIGVERLSFRVGDRDLFRDLNFILSPAQRVGLVGPNGSGKTTLLRLITGEFVPTTGEIERASNLRIVYFDQNRAQLNLDVTLRRALAPDGDSVIYRNQVIHVASWAARFLFTREQLDQPVSRLSGGERARLLIANLMLEPADLLLLDEPTNDLDIPTLEILEESLLDFTGALVLVTHDRYLLDRVSTQVIGLDGFGGAERFADYRQWEAWQTDRRAARSTPKPAAPSPAPRAQSKRKLSFLETREWDGIEARIAESETALSQKQALLEDPAVTRDGQRLRDVYTEIQSAQETVDALYARWAELEAKLAG